MHNSNTQPFDGRALNLKRKAFFSSCSKDLFLSVLISTTDVLHITPDKSGYLKNIFLISPGKHVEGTYSQPSLYRHSIQ